MRHLTTFRACAAVALAIAFGWSAAALSMGPQSGAPQPPVNTEQGFGIRPRCGAPQAWYRAPADV